MLERRWGGDKGTSASLLVDPPVRHGTNGNRSALKFARAARSITRVMNISAPHKATLYQPLGEDSIGSVRSQVCGARRSPNGQ